MKKTNIEAENARLKSELSESKRQNSESKKQIKNLSQKIEKKDSRISNLEKELKKKRRAERNIEQKTRTITFDPIEGYSYSEVIVRLTTLLYTRVKCGLRSVVEIMKVVNDVFDNFLGKVPCYNTIRIWMEKCGLKVYNVAGESIKGIDYALITDESMMIGREKLLLTLAVPAKHQGRPLSCEDVNVVDIAVAESWNGENIGVQLQKASEKVGYNPEYVTTDNGSTMNKGVRCAKMVHHHDISHSLAMYAERAYGKEVDFIEYVTLMTKSKFKYNMTKIAYMLPPNQRTISRFMNLSDWVEWSSKMLDKYDTLDVDEQKAFSFIPANASFIDELSDVVECIERIEHLFKHNGLSIETVCKCEKVIQAHLLHGNSRMIKLGESIKEYLINEAMLLETDTAPRNNSTDIIESIFGKFKDSKSPNKLSGITTHILFLPIYTKLKNREQAKKFDFKGALEDIRIGDIDDWAKKNLTQNLVQLRRKRLQKAG